MRRAVGALVRKDLRLELRAPQVVPAMAIFAVMTLVVFHFALQRRAVEGDLAAGVLCVTLLFAAMLGISRLFVADREEGGFDGFLLAPVDRTALLVAKVLALLGYLVAARAGRGPRVRAPAARARRRRRGLRALLALLLLADVGIAVVGTLVAPSPSRPAPATSSSRSSRCRCSCRSSSAWHVRARRCSPRRARGSLPGRWLAVLGLYDLVFGLLAYACSTTWSRTDPPHVRQAPSRPLHRDRRHADGRVRARLLLRAEDADQGFMQKIFYVHVPLAIVALCGFVSGGIWASSTSARTTARWDLSTTWRSTSRWSSAWRCWSPGSIWAKASWGSWWVWDEPTLVSFLIVFLLYACYQPLRFSIEDPEKQARYASVFAVIAGAFVPLNFLAVRLASALVHPRVFATADGGLPARMKVAFYVCLLGMALLYVTLWQLRDGVEERGAAACAPLSASSAATRPWPRAGAPRRRASRA